MFPSGNSPVKDGKTNFQSAPTVPFDILYADQRDTFISWLRGEFAAANAIIDCLTHHIRTVGEPREYDAVIDQIQQRRCNWSPVLNMQRYFPVDGIGRALNRVESLRKKQDRRSDRHGNEFRWAGSEFDKNQGGGRSPEAAVEELRGADNDNVVTRSDLESKETLERNLSDLSLSDGCRSTSKEGEEDLPSQNESQVVHPAPKTFVRNEIFSEKMVNVVEGMELYENLLDDAEVKRLVSLVNDYRDKGKRGQFQDQTYIMLKRPFRGRGREIIQLGLPIVNPPVEDEKVGIPQERRMNAMPSILRDVIERIIAMNIMTIKPDSCIIDFFDTADHSQPYSWPHWFGRPIFLLSLTECSMTFGRLIALESPGNYKGSLKLSMSPGSLLAMQGKSADFLRYALSSSLVQRILITFTKSQPKKSIPADTHLVPLPAIIQYPHSGPTPNKPIDHIRRPAAVGPMYYGPLPQKTVPALNGMQPRMVAGPVMPLQAPVPIAATYAPGWTGASPLHSALPHLSAPGTRIPGTGVFIPPASMALSSLKLPPPSTADHNPSAERD